MDKALYTVHSWDIPYAQENSTLNYCWQAHDGDVKLAPFCQVFIVRIPGLYKGAKERIHTISFESVCLPGHFLKQKNYHMILQKRDGSDLFGEDIVCYFFLLCFCLFVCLFCLLSCFFLYKFACLPADLGILSYLRQGVSKKGWNLGSPDMDGIKEINKL